MPHPLPATLITPAPNANGGVSIAPAILVATTPSGAPSEVLGLSPAIVGGALGYSDVGAFAFVIADSPVRVRLSENLNGLFIDSEISTVWLPDSVQSIGAARAITQELGDSQYAYSIRSISLDGDLLSVRGETILSLLSRTPAPKQFFALGPFTAAQALENILDALGIVASNVPANLFLRTSNGREEPSVKAISITWAANSQPPSILDVLNQLLAPFDGYAIRANAQNQLEFIVPWWAEGASTPTIATATPKLILTNRDLIDAPMQAANRDTIVNRAVVTSRQYGFVAGQSIATKSARTFNVPTTPLAQQLWLAGALPPPEIFKYDYQPGASYEAFDAVIYNGQRFLARTNTSNLPTHSDWELSGLNGWEDAGNFIPFADNILIDGAVKIQANLANQWVKFSGPGGFPVGGQGSDAHTITVPADGSEVSITKDVYVDLFFAGTDRFFFRQGVDATGKAGIFLRSETLNYPVTIFQFFVAYRLFMEFSGATYKESGSTIRAQSENGDSINQYGVQVKNLDMGILSLSEATCQKIATALVLNNSRPDLEFDVRLCPPWVLNPEHVGRLIQLPDGQKATVLSRQYDEAQTTTTSQTSVMARLVKAI